MNIENFFVFFYSYLYRNKGGIFIENQLISILNGSVIFVKKKSLLEV